MANHPKFRQNNADSMANPLELPFRIKGSFKPLIDFWETQASDSSSELHSKANQVLQALEQAPELKAPFQDFTLIEKYEEEIALLFSAIFPPLLSLNEIKLVALPFNEIFFNPSTRLFNILSNSPDQVSFKYRNMDHDAIYISGAVVALARAFGWNANFSRPLFWDLQDEKTGIKRHYRVLFNADFAEFKTNENSPQLTQDDFYELMDDFENIELWKEKIPPGSFDFEGFLILNMFDVTNQEGISQLKDALLKREGLLSNEMKPVITEQIRKIFNISDLEVGFVAYNRNSQNFENAFLESWASLSLKKNGSCEKTTFCTYSGEQLLKAKKPFVARDVDLAYQMCPHDMYNNLKERGINSYTAVPFFKDGELLGVLEIGSPRKNELNNVTVIKLQDVIPSFDIAIKRAVEEFENELEAVIQEQCTAIHPSVKWKFLLEAEEVVQQRLVGMETSIPDITFPEVTPFFGQIDVKGSSGRRNKAIQEDLVRQLKLAKKVMESAIETQGMILFDAIRHQIKFHLSHIKEELLAGDETRVLAFLKDEVYPAFRHLAAINPRLKAQVDDYESQLNPSLGVIFDKRKDYEQSVNELNIHLAEFIDKEQQKAQEIFPHYFEKYKTDGVEYNMYVGQSISNDKQFDDIYLQNLRLWQLKLMVDLENEWYRVNPSLPMPLEVASLILVQSNPMAIRFRTDEKKFDVDGAYNARYEIIKKRIDKAHIKGTNERLTVPGKIAIVYTQEEDAREYLKYIDFLKAQGLITNNVEILELEELQGAAGLKALRIEVAYKKAPKQEPLSDTKLEDILKTN